MKCTKCEAYKDSPINCVSFYGNKKADVLFLGEMFGRTEIKERKPFVGDAGSKLTELLNLINIKRKDIAITNSLRCYLDGNATPPKKMLDACFIHLFNEVIDIKPKLIVAMGATAFYQSTGISKEYFSEYIGKAVYSDRLNCNILVTYHPAASLYDPNKWSILVDQFRQIPFLLNKQKVKIKHYKYEYILNKNDFNKHFSRLKNAKYIYFDTETTGLSPYTDDLVLVQIGDGKEPILVIDSSILEEIKTELKFLLETKQIVGQGFEFDAKFLYTKLGILIKHWYFDTCIAEFVISGLKHNDLTFLTAKYVPESSGYDFEIKQAGGFHRILDKRKAIQYSADDIGVLYKIHKRQIRYLKKHNQWYLLSNIIMPNNKVLTKMSLAGIKYDVDKLIALDRKYEKKARKAFVRISDLESIKACEQHFKKKFNPRSTKQVKWLLIDYYGLPILKTTKKGNPSLGKKELKTYAEKHKNEYCIAMQKYRIYESLRANQLSGVLPYLIDERAHTEYSLHATTTGRSASYNPNLLNLQPEVKKCIIPYIPKIKEKCYFVKADMSQLEIRVASVMYYDPIMIEYCNSGKDFHSLVASKVVGKRYEDFISEIKEGNPKYKEIRKVNKAVGFGIIYQEGPDGLSYNLGISRKKAEQFIEEYFEQFSNLKDKIEETKQQLIKYGYVDSYFKLRRRWEFHTKDNHQMLREGVNFIIQSTAWQLCQMAMNDIDDELQERNLKSRLVMQIHDENILEVPESELEIIKVIVPEIMSKVNEPFPVLNEVKLSADLKVVETLGG